MKKIIRLTESDLHKIVKESVNRILKEEMPTKSKTYFIFNEILDGYKADEMADQYGLSREEAAVEWFKGVCIEDNFGEGNMPQNSQYVTDIPELDAELYVDYGADYFFLVKEAHAPMSMAVEGRKYDFDDDEDDIDDESSLHKKIKSSGKKKSKRGKYNSYIDDL